MRNRFALCALVLSHALSAGAAEEFSIEAEQNGDHIEVRGRALIAATPMEIWRVISDYEGLQRFIPGIAHSAVLAREGNRARVTQRGELRFLFFSHPFEVELDVTESPFERIASRALRGNVKRMEARYELRPEPVRGGVWLLYFGWIEPESDLPPLIGLFAFRLSIKDQFAAMVREIERRRDEAGRAG